MTSVSWLDTAKFNSALILKLNNSIKISIFNAMQKANSFEQGFTSSEVIFESESSRMLSTSCSVTLA